jgi:hypothetical protein
LAQVTRRKPACRSSATAVRPWAQASGDVAVVPVSPLSTRPSTAPRARLALREPRTSGSSKAPGAGHHDHRIALHAQLRQRLGAGVEASRP